MPGGEDSLGLEETTASPGSLHPRRPLGNPSTAKIDSPFRERLDDTKAAPGWAGCVHHAVRAPGQSASVRGGLDRFLRGCRTSPASHCPRVTKAEQVTEEVHAG